MRKIKLLLTVLVLVVFVSNIFAQEIQVSGTVTDGTTKEAIPFATIVVKGTTTGINSDENGKYTISVSPDATLIFSCIGYINKEVAVNAKKVINVQLESDAIALDDVVVIGYGSARKVGTTIASVTKVSSKTLEAKPQSSALESLQGQVAGLQVFTSSGDPGEQQSIRLHGIGSLTASNAPLYILDGIAVDSRTILSMNPNDIESLSVLKDASATSIYGSRAANGVIYVTTKRGSSGNAVIKISGQYGVSSLADKSFHNRMMNTDQLLSFWEEVGIRTSAQIESLKASLAKAGAVRKDGSLNNFKWIDYMQKDNRPAWQANMSISGSGNKTSYYVSGSAFDEQGTAPGTYFKRYTIRSNTDSRLTDWFKFGTNIQLSLDKRQTNSNYGTNSTGGGLSFLRPPYYSPYDKDGNEPNIIPGTTWANPYYYTDNNPDNYTRYGAIINGFIELEPVKDLIIRSSAGINGGIIRNSWKTLPSYMDKNNGTRGESASTDYTNTITNTIEYSFNINDKNKLVVLAGQEGILNKYDYFYALSEGQTDDRLLHLGNGKTDTYKMSSTDTESQFLSFFGRADYSFDNRIFLDASIRNDASSRFGANNRNATFWAAGAMWNIKNEQFLKDVNWLNTLTFKVSYGTQGNAAIGDYTSLATVGETTKYNQTASWVLSSAGNPNLTWETQTKLTVALNTMLFDRLRVGVEYYNRSTKDMLMEVPVPRTTGYGSIMNNVGTLTNNGIDFTLGYDILKGKDYFLGFNFNINYNSEKITELFDGRKRWEIANTGVAYVVGKPIMFYYPIFAGINPENGNMQWYLPGDDVDVTTKDPNRLTEELDDAKLTQNTGIRRYAPISGGFNVNGSWKGISLSADFSFVLGKNLISNDRFFAENPINFAGFNTSSDVLNYWKKPGDIVDYPDWKKGSITWFDTRILENASFMRLKNLTLSYTLPNKVLANSKSLHGLKVFLTGRNLWTLKSKDFKGMDPEVDSNLSIGRVINSKQFQAGIELTF